jgi:regulatory protein
MAPRTRHELQDDLIKRGIPDDVVERVLDRFTEVGLIDDTEYAAMWVTSRQRTRGSARSVLRQELRRKGVGDDETESALATISSEDEAERARALVDRKLAAMGVVDEKAVGRRLTNMLVRRGYAPGLAYATVRDALHMHGVQMAEDFR